MTEESELPFEPIDDGDRRAILVLNLQQLAFRMSSRVDMMIERDGSIDAAVTGRGVGISFLFARDIARAMDKAAKLLDQDWQPIETAPKDGNAFLAYGIHTGSPPDAQRGVVAGDHWWAIILWDVWRPAVEWAKAPARWVFAKDGKPTWSEPTYWMALPEPPQRNQPT